MPKTDAPPRLSGVRPLSLRPKRSESKHAWKRPEIIVFGLIIVFVAALSLVSLPQQSSRQDQSYSPEDVLAGAQVAYKSDLPVLAKAPELTGTQRWINSEQLTIAGLKGKVVIVDFWTYTCINCIRTLPFLNSWHEKYADDGLVILGVHTPEFEFEKDYDNVAAAVDKYGIKYAVVQDNNYETWQAYKNRFWPRKYVIDKEGNIRYDHIGEGAYEETEKVIQDLLREISSSVQNGTTTGTTSDFSQIGTPELYLGYDFARAPLGNAEGFSPDSIVDYRHVNATKVNTIYLAGEWENRDDSMVSVNNSRLFLIYTAKDVNIVAGGYSGIKVKLDGNTLHSDDRGLDVTITGNESAVVINEQRLYNIVSAPGYGTHLLEIQAQPRFELYTFTFG